MPSLRQKVTTYFRQFSFIADREERMASQNKVSDGSFITQFLEGTLKPPDSVPIVNSGKAPEDLPEYDIGEYKTVTDSVTAAYTGPGEGLTSIRRVRVHLFADSEIDFIDTINEHEIQNERGVSKKATNTLSNNFGTDSNANKRLHQRNDNSKTQYNIKYGDNESLYSAKKRELQLLHKSNDQIIDNTEIRGTPDDTPIDPIANVKNWNLPNDNAYGISVSLYEKNLLSGENVGNPVADCFGILVRNNCCIMALADGVNWGNGARLAAQCAVQGSIDYLNSAIFGIHLISSTKDIFVSLVRSFWEAHSYIIEAGGALTTLSVVVVLPLLENKEKHVVCCCNVGDSLGYVYSKKYGIREITQASHDVDSMRDMRDALGALGPVNGDKPEITNLTLALTMVEKDDIIFLTSDGISDNFDPVVGKFAVPLTNKVQFSNHSVFLSSRTENSHLLAKRQNKNSISRKPQPNGLSESSTSCKLDTDSNSSIYQQSSQLKRRMFEESSSKGTRPVYLRSKTFIEPRLLSTDQKIKKTMLPQVTGAQRHQLTLLRMADLLMYGINGTLRPSTSAKQLCQLLVDFATCITSAKRKSLEQRELYYKVITSKDGCCKEIGFTKHQQKIARKRIVEGSTFALLPGKLDHASVVAFTVGSERVFNESYL